MVINFYDKIVFCRKKLTENHVTSYVRLFVNNCFIVYCEC
jgi:hypothetical protein